jgi:hypothetical protein
MPNALPAMLEERVLAFAIAHPGLGPRRVASELGCRRSCRAGSSSVVR